MNFKTNSWHAKLHTFAYEHGDDLPEDGCQYFRKVIWAVLTFPLYFLCYPFMDSWDRREVSWIGKVLTQQLVLMLLVLFYGFGCDSLCQWCVTGYDNQTMFFYDHATWWMHLLGLPVGLLMFAIPVTILFSLFIGVQWGYEKLTDDKFEDSPKQDGLLKSRYKAFKQKYCPVINWDEEE